MYTIGERIKGLESKGVSWASLMSKKHADRWEYLHSPFHAAAYALDPEYLETVGELDAAMQEGLMTVLERMCLRDAIMSAADPDAAITLLTTSSPAVISRVAQVAPTTSPPPYHHLTTTTHTLVAHTLTTPS